MWFLILAFATWRLTKLLVKEDGPFNIFARFRAFVGVEYDEFSVPVGKNVVADGLTCMWCTSVWVALFFTLISDYTRDIQTFVVAWFAISAGAIFLEEILDLIMQRG